MQVAAGGIAPADYLLGFDSSNSTFEEAHVCAQYSA